MNIKKRIWSRAALLFIGTINSEEINSNLPIMRALYMFSHFLDYVAGNGYYQVIMSPRYQTIRVYEFQKDAVEWSYKDYSDDEDYGDIDMYINMVLDFYDNVINKEKENA